ncbi:NADH-quinone oxidoreductase subunit K [Lysobacter sp. LF1]|uniref:NADH-quinone oxidoreductase subunit K n=1 Tax=Lysobacter stagni TaxID=3045172 RepID=A0ABT6XI62_9GAMM|nr:NADH-quinone oxidoreductase subunit K [Lysobacter sp. LF1]MDI9239845.1 NADH-quinone oxidoreductase subunit K [Lysobacter sp. LF1]
MNTTVVFGTCAALLVGLGLYGLIVEPRPLRKVLSFNLMSTGVFLLCAVIARRAGASIADPVPQALLITAIVVAFAASALAVAVLLRLAETADSVSLDPQEDDGEAPP